MMTEWQPIENAPKNGIRVIICDSEGNIDVADYIGNWTYRQEFVRHAKDGDVYKEIKEECGYWNTLTACCPTHWMPLPPPPKETP